MFIPTYNAEGMNDEPAAVMAQPRRARQTRLSMAPKCGDSLTSGPRVEVLPPSGSPRRYKYIDRGRVIDPPPVDEKHVDGGS